MYLVAVAVLVGGGLLAGGIFKGWGLLGSVGFAFFLAYAWEFSSEGVAYATIAGVVASVAVIAGIAVRRQVG
jgi:hypothetical protein